uniref:condensation domain-containing protein n=1 Tax=Paenibacillus turpanensis TaxID=2689078 RepID=UPI00140896CB
MGNGAEIQKVYPLSPMQSGMLFHSITDRDSHAYFEQMVMRLKGHLDKVAFVESFQRLIQRHEVLRTIFIYDQVKKPLQVVLKERKAEVRFEAAYPMEAGEQAEYEKRWIEQDKKRGFDPTSDLLMRVSVLQTGNEEYTVIWSHHHILMDGWCMSILFGEFFEIYKALCAGQALSLPAPAPFSQYIDWLEKQDKARASAFWKTYLDGFGQTTPILKSAHAARGDYVYNVFSRVLDAEQSAALLEAAGECKVTLNNFMQSAWGVLLQKYNHTQDAVFGSVVSGRPAELAGVEEMIGLFINTLPTRVRSEGVETFAELAAAFHEASAQARSYEYYPLYEIHAERSLKEGLFDHLIAFENFPVSKEVESMSEDLGLGFTIEADEESFEQTNYDFNLIIVPGSSIKLKVQFNESAVRVEKVEQILSHYMYILSQVSANPEIRLSEIETATPEERRTLVWEWNATEREYNRSLRIHEPFEVQAERYPERAALCMDGQELPYGELNRRANQVANYLLQQGVVPGTFIGIMMDRGFDMIAGVLGILKAGAAYIPVEPSFPAARLEHIFGSMKVPLVLTQARHAEKLYALEGLLPELGLARGVLLDEPGLLSGFDEANPVALEGAAADQPAYAIFTSGSTGVPKGVIVRHQPVINLIEWAERMFG